MELKYNYVNGETPEERLRNKLQPLFFLVELVSSLDITDKDEGLGDIVKACNDSMEDIREHLSDIVPFYTNVPKLEFTQNNSIH